MPAAPTCPTGKRSKPGRLNEGAPTKRTPELTTCIAESISLGLTDEEAAALRLRDRLLLINTRVDNWQSISWLVERQYYSRFAKPEVQIAINNSFNQTVNALLVTIAEIRDIEAVAEPIRASVRQMFERYKPNHGSGDQEANGSISTSV
jgi:hypothetical protein